jgi:hypothetical protein
VEVREHSIGEHEQNHSAYHVEGGNSQPQNAQQMNVPPHSPRPQLHRHHGADNLLTAHAAKRLSRLHRRAASIAEHGFLRPIRRLKLLPHNKPCATANVG